MIRTLTFDEAAKFLGVSATSLDDLVQTGEIPGAKISRGWIFREEDLDDYLKEQVRIQTQQRRDAYLTGKSVKVKTTVGEVRGVSKNGRRRELPVLPDLPVASV